jgi:hypothetical protein
MKELSTFEIAAGSASIIALALMVLGITNRAIRRFKRRRESAKEEFEHDIAKYRAAGSTVSARTDLGFFFSIKLGGLRTAASYYNHLSTKWLLIAVISVQFALNMDRADWETFFAAGLGLGAVLLSVVYISLAWRWEQYTRSLIEQIKEIWEEPISKRTDKSGENS